MKSFSDNSLKYFRSLIKIQYEWPAEFQHRKEYLIGYKI